MVGRRILPGRVPHGRLLKQFSFVTLFSTGCQVCPELNPRKRAIGMAVVASYGMIVEDFVEERNGGQYITCMTN